MKRLRFSPWLVALLAAHLLLGSGNGLWLALACVTLHEMGHVAAARLCGCPAESVELSPVGGAARIRGLEGLSPGRAAAVALAGPAVNLLLAVSFGCTAYCFPKTAAFCTEMLEINLGLMLFNLLPAFPMDGGRVVCALMSRRGGALRAQRCASALGVAVGAALIALGCVAMAATGKVNLTLLLSGGYVIFAAAREHRAAPLTYLRMLEARQDELCRRRVLPVRTLAAAPGVTAAELRAHLLPGAVYRVVLLNEEMRPVREIWEEELSESIGDPALSFDKEGGGGYNQKYQQRMTQEG